ncbi:MAG: effector-associated constant component EACC1 [Pseudonocardiaceae bacterium]
MDVTASVAGRDAAGEELRSLSAWLAGEEEFRGRVRLVEAAPEPGTLGGWPEAVVVALSQGGAVTVLTQRADCLDPAPHQRGDVHGDPAGRDVD